MSSQRGTYYEIEQLRKRVEELENTLKKFLDNWVTVDQKRRDERDAKWDEMVRVLTVQQRKSK